MRKYNAKSRLRRLVAFLEVKENLPNKSHSENWKWSRKKNGSRLLYVVRHFEMKYWSVQCKRYVFKQSGRFMVLRQAKETSMQFTVAMLKRKTTVIGFKKFFIAFQFPNRRVAPVSLHCFSLLGSRKEWPIGRVDTNFIQENCDVSNLTSTLLLRYTTSKNLCFKFWHHSVTTQNQWSCWKNWTRSTLFFPNRFDVQFCNSCSHLLELCCACCQHYQEASHCKKFKYTTEVIAPLLVTLVLHSHSHPVFNATNCWMVSSALTSCLKKKDHWSSVDPNPNEATGVIWKFNLWKHCWKVPVPRW